MDAGFPLIHATKLSITSIIGTNEPKSQPSKSLHGSELADAYHRFLLKDPKYLQSETPPSHLPAYRWSILFMFTSPFYVFLTDWTPVGLVFAYSLISLVTLPVMVALLFVLTADPRRMGDQANSLFTNLVLLGTIGFSISVAWQGYLELSQNHL